MDANKHRRRWLSFSIRDLLWAMVVVAVAAGWAADRHRHPENVSVMLISTSAEAIGLSPGDKAELEVMGDGKVSQRIIRAQR